MKKNRLNIFGSAVLAAFLIFACGNAEVPLPQKEALYQKGVNFAAEGRWKEAREEFKKVLEASKTDSTSLSSLKVLRDFEEGSLSQEFTLLFFKGIAFLVGNQPREAIVELQKALLIKEDYAKVYNILGMAYASSGDTAQAIAHFKKALKINPSYTEALFNLASYQSSLGNYQQALECYQIVIALEPDSGDAYADIAGVYAALDQYPQSISYYRKLIALNSLNGHAYYNLGLAYFMIDDFTRARESLASAKEIFQQKNDLENVEVAGAYLEKLKQFEDTWGASR
ncbi:MAG: tetratricopeptide repeat protein [Candidatus Omnitrophota bacterium]